MNTSLFKKLLEQKFINEDEFKRIQQQQPVNVYWDLRTMLHIGILLVTTAVGILVYKNIDTISHSIIVSATGVCSAVCFIYCLKKTNGYSNIKIESPTILFDYILLTGCLLLLMFIGYVQYQYSLLGSRWNLAVFIPTIILFFTAYYFDHLGVLSLAITNLAAWLGITVAPLQILNKSNFNDTRLIYAGIVLGTALIIFSFISTGKNIKSHFAFTYKNFGAHFLFVSLLAGMFYYHGFYLLWFLVLAVSFYLFLIDSVKRNSFYFLTVSVLYMYIAITYIVIRFLFTSANIDSGLYIIAVYFIASGIGLIKFLMHYNRRLKHDSGLQ